jgi:AraC-like DNA-binding protein
MKVVNYDFDTNSNWLEVVANAMGGVIEGNTLKADNDLYKGIHLVSEIEEGVTIILADITYKETMLVKSKNDMDTSFVCLCFYLFDSNVDFIFDGSSVQFGELDYNFLMIDGTLRVAHQVNKKGTEAYIICIIIKKNAIKDYLKKVHKFTDDVFLDTKKNTIINLDRMPHESLDLIKDFRKTPRADPFYEMNFKALVYKLLDNYLEQVKTKKMIIGKVVNDDIKRIIVSQKFLQNSDEGVFPGIDFLASEALMSASKYKKMFTKILGLSPAVYFYNNKLEKAKELLETKQYTVGEIAEKLKFSNVSYFSKGFSKRYGVSPKEYQNLL